MVSSNLIVDKIFLSKEVQTNLPVNNSTLTDLQEKVWYVVKNVNTSILAKTNYFSNYQYILKKNDIIKLGRIKFVVKDLNIVDGSYTSTSQTFRPYFEHE